MCVTKHNKFFIMMTNVSINSTTLTTERFYRFQLTRQYGITKKEILK